MIFGLSVLWLTRCCTVKHLGNAKLRKSSLTKWQEFQFDSETPWKFLNQWKISLRNVWKSTRNKECLWKIWKIGLLAKSIQIFKKTIFLPFDNRTYHRSSISLIRQSAMPKNYLKQNRHKDFLLAVKGTWIRINKTWEAGLQGWHPFPNLW